MHIALAPHGLWQGRVHEFPTLPSTNQWALAHGVQYVHGDVLWAHNQTSGHGRFDRPWLSHGECGLTFSVVLDPARFNAPTPNLGQVAALAIRQTLRSASLAATLKWPNDVLVLDRKIAGILLESGPDSQRLVLGIGLNVNQPLPLLQGLDRPATSMFLELRKATPPRDVLACLLRDLQAYLDLYRTAGLDAILAEWRNCDALDGQSIEVHLPDRPVAQGRYAGLDENGCLRLKNASGVCQVFWSGDVVRVQAITPDVR